ncbi:MAG: FlgD immunoglobulin-like domain containing protein [Candidatus Zixiibacteriota bacterium]
MRRLVVPLTLLILLIGLAAGSAQAQVPPRETDESLGFLKDIKAGPGDTVAIPIYLRNDSVVTGLQMGFHFDHNLLLPILQYDKDYDSIVNYYTNAGTPELIPDSTEWTGSGAPGLWYMYFNPSDSLRRYNWGNTSAASNQVLYNLNERDSARLLMIPLYTATNPPYIPAMMESSNVAASGDTVGVFIGTIPFLVNPNAEHGDDAQLQVYEFYYSNSPGSSILNRTQFSEKEVHDTTLYEIDNTVDPPDTTRIIDTTVTFEVTTYPQDLLAAYFIVDTTTGGSGGGDENDLPVLATITPSVYNIQQGELVSFTVTATDAEAGVLTIRANGGSLTTPNASFGTGGVVTGAGGLATGIFSFRPALGQEGTFAFTFQAQDDSGAVSGTQAVTITVEGFDEDILFTTSSEEYTPAGGVPGFSEVIVPIGIVTEKTIYGIQFDLEYNDNYFLLDSIFSSDRTMGWEIFDDVGATPGRIRIVTFGLSNDSMVAGSTSAALYLAMTVDEFAEPGCYDLNIFNGYESIDPDPNVPGLELVTDSGIMCVDQWGDINLDRNVNVADLVSCVGYIISNFTLNNRQFAAGDVVPNDTVNVIDLVGIINVIFGLPISPDPSPAPIGEFATLKVWHDEIPWAGIESEVIIGADMPTEIAGVELDISYNPNAVEMMKPILADASSGFKIYSTDNGTGHMKVLIHSNHPWEESELIPEGLGDIIKLPFVSKAAIAYDDTYQVRVTRAVMTTGAAKGVDVEGVTEDPILPDHFELYQNRPNPFNPTTDISFYIDGSFGIEHVTLTVFNILGQSVKTLMDKELQPGQYTVTWDGTDNWGAKTASGVYLYRLQVGDADKTKKMVLLK